MSKITVLAPVKLAPGKSEADLLAASKDFQENFVAHEPGVLRRELVRKTDGTYLDIIQFRSEADYHDVLKKEMESEVCIPFFAVMDMSEEPEMELLTSLQTFGG